MGFLTGEGSLFNRIFGFLGQMILLNLLWMVCSLPVVTAGASTTALFYCTLKLHKDKDIRVIRDFFKSFRQNFGQSTMAWLLLLLAGGVIWMEKEALTSYAFIPLYAGADCMLCKAGLANWGPALLSDIQAENIGWAK